MERRDLSRYAGNAGEQEPLSSEVLANMDFPWTEMGNPRWESQVPGVFRDVCNESFTGRLSFEGGTYNVQAMHASPEAFVEARESSEFDANVNFFVLKFGDLTTSYTLALQAVDYRARDDKFSRDLPQGSVDFRVTEFIVREGEGGPLRQVPKTSAVLIDGMLTYLQDFTAKLPNASFRHFFTNGDPRGGSTHGTAMPQEKWNELFVATLEKHGYQAVGKDEQGSDVWWRDYNVPTT